MLILLCLVIAIVVSPMFISHQFVVAYKKRLLNIPDKSKIRSKEVSRFTTGLRYQLGYTILTTALNFLMFVCGFSFFTNDFRTCFMFALATLGVLSLFFYYNVFGNLEHSRTVFMGDTGSPALGFYWYFSLFGVQYTVFRNIRLPHILGYVPSIVCSYIFERVVNAIRRIYRMPINIISELNMMYNL